MTPEDKQFIQEALQTTRAELTARIEHSQAQTIEAMRDMQTEILRGIQAFATSNYARMHRIETSDTVTNTRIEALEQRMLALEMRQQPPQ
jgi:hypothetical protein